MKKPSTLILALILGGCQLTNMTDQTAEHAQPDAAKTDKDLQASTDQNGQDSKAAKIKKDVLPALVAEAAPDAAKRDNTIRSKALPELINSYFEYQVGHRMYMQVDKPLYKPGETIWFKTWDLKVRTLTGSDQSQTRVELISPKGATVLKKTVAMVAGTASNDFEIPPDAQGGEYTLRTTSADGQTVARAIIVSAYEAPRMKKKLEFIKKSYGAGEQVSATVEVKRPTGEVLANKPITAIITVDGVELPRVKATTNSEGDALVKFDLPKKIDTGDGLLTILVEDGGITESISKSIPILQKKLALSFFPEGGKMVAGLPTRLYFEAKNRLGKPADVEGRLVDDQGNIVARFATYKNGLGRIAFTPATGRSYHAEISKPDTVTETYTLPLAEESGCVLRSYDDLDGQEKDLRIAVQCSEKQKVVVAATVRENLFDAGAIDAGPDKPAVIYLRAGDAAIRNAAGIARVTVFDQALNPLAERLVFRNRRNRLDIKVEADKKSYAPRGQVALSITTRDISGKPMPAELALAVVDDTVLSFADDKSAHLLSRLLLESELPGKVEEPNFYMDLGEEKSALALDMLMGTRGYRRFDWVPVVNSEYPRRVPMGVARGGFANPVMMRMLEVPMPVPAPIQPIVMAPPPDMKKVAEGKPFMQVAQRPNAIKAEAQMAQIVQHLQAPRAAVAADVRPANAPVMIMIPEERAVAGNVMAKELVDKDFARAAAKVEFRFEEEPLALAPVRVFPVPAYQSNPANQASHDGPRDDYRETIMWAPSIKTDKQGKANLKFFLSDAVTSFRVSAEGVGSASGQSATGLAGRNETVIKSSLPFSLSAKLPLEISAGDHPLIPVTLTNESEQSMPVSMDSSFGAMLKETAKSGNGKLSEVLAAGQRKSLFIPVEVTGVRGQSEVRLSATAAGLKDEILRSIPVVAPGFPQLFQKSGQIKGQASHELDLSKASKGSVQATIKVYTSSLSTMISGLEGMLREPSGCFEQTSSTNYPNVMIMQYLKQHDVADTALLERTGKLLDSGYKKLAGFESPKKGYEWFGGDPGHEALTAYGLLEFADMKPIYGSVDRAMLERTAAWLKSRRDGNGGYQRDAKALDSFGSAAPAVTDAYITWALVSAGETGLDKEIARSAKLAESTQDAYQLALATGAMLEKGSASAVTDKARQAAVDKLTAMQSASGAWTNADHSITRSGGSNLQIETTSLAILSMLKAGGHLEQARKGIDWLQNNRSGFGQWGATQATVLALKAMIAFDNATRIAPKAGKISLLIDGVVVREQSYEAGRREAVMFTDIDDLLTPGKHSISLQSKSPDALPYSIAVEYRSTEPASSKEAVIHLNTSLAKADMKMGETVRMDAIVSNTTQIGQPMSLVRLGLPGGLTFQNWQLKEMREKGQIAFFETRAREVILYFRDMKPGEVRKLAIDLVATVPGTYTGPASSAYLYYNDTDKTWTAPMSIHITP
ncbi:MG2 domain-containing protein [Undibacterium sp. Ji50W]|uniref:MG2 domain-containing protein n=1 Tax=Undibacterium sp. Ji50W TaxID=3413041 RepID=UPI003BF1CF04